MKKGPKEAYPGPWNFSRKSGHQNVRLRLSVCLLVYWKTSEGLRPPYTVPEIFHDSRAKERKGNIW